MNIASCSIYNHVINSARVAKWVRNQEVVGPAFNLGTLTISISPGLQGFVEYSELRRLSPGIHGKGSASQINPGSIGSDLKQDEVKFQRATHSDLESSKHYDTRSSSTAWYSSPSPVNAGKAKKIPSLSIVVGLMLVFRNQTSYNRFWDGRNGMNTLNTCVRNLVRTIATNSYNSKQGPPTAAEREDIERTVRILMAIPYAVKNHLRAEWGAAWVFGNAADEDLNMHPSTLYNPEYANLLPAGLEGHEDEGLGLPFQLTFFIDGFIKRGEQRGWYPAPGASQMQAQLNTLTDAYGRMETIKLTPIPVAHLIHQKQVLALFGCVLPFAMVDEMGWWAIPIVSLVIFTLYGIEGIGSQLEDPFGYDRNDIKMDAIAGDSKTEIDVVLAEWRTHAKAMEVLREQPAGATHV
ncbi:hypothetical protein PENPOL_c001G05706 [Penicillium polonicum]|uniref:Uncharacterized protein n=1 Tax=Penicillium polonicum TaxID=60169 RepID=A0A1V6P2Y0_PENPO|nr:hypothetical protein PENPOL_c001G05706 [Penicillium polonicum]